MRRFPRCPNCGHEVIGTECKCCHYRLTSHRPIAKNEAQRQTFQVVKQPEQTAAGLTTKAKTEADAKSAALITGAEQRAAQIIREAEQTATELTAKAKTKADTIINQGFRIASLTMKQARTGNQAEQRSKQKQNKHSNTQK